MYVNIKAVGVLIVCLCSLFVLYGEYLEGVRELITSKVYATTRNEAVSTEDFLSLLEKGSSSFSTLDWDMFMKYKESEYKTRRETIHQYCQVSTHHLPPRN